MLRPQTTAFVGACLVVVMAACNRGTPSPASAPVPEPADARARALADAYLEGFFERNPDQVTLFGVPGRRHDALPDNSLAALRALSLIHISEPTRLLSSSYAVFCLKKKNK